MALHAKTHPLKGTAERMGLSQLLRGQWSPVHGGGASTTDQCMGQEQPGILSG